MFYSVKEPKSITTYHINTDKIAYIAESQIEAFVRVEIGFGEDKGVLTLLLNPPDAAGLIRTCQKDAEQRGYRLPRVHRRAMSGLPVHIRLWLRRS